MTHLFENSEGVIHKSNSNVKKFLWQINSVCAVIIIHLEIQVLKKYEPPLLESQYGCYIGLKGCYPSAETQSQAPDLLLKAA